MRLNWAMLRALIFLGVAATAVVLGYVGFSEYLSHYAAQTFGRGWADILYYALQLFLLGAPLGPAPGPFPVPLQIARFLAPATTVLAGVETLRLLLGEQLRQWEAAHARKHAIVTGDGPAAIELARRLRDERGKVVLVSATPVVTGQARRHRLLEVSGDPTDPGTLQAAGLSRAEAVYACTDHSATNAAIALRAREISQARGRALAAYAQVRDAEISTALRARRIGAPGDPQFRLDFFSIEEIAARVLLDRYPLVTGSEQAAEVVIIGFGRLGGAVLREIARRQPPSGPPPKVTVVHGETAEDVPRFLDRFPVIGRNCSVTYAADMPRPLADDAPRLMFVCLPDNDEALRAGLAGAHTLTGRSDRVVICMAEPSPFGTVITGDGALLDDAKGRLTVFEVLGEACVPEQIRDDLIDQLARAIHHAYVGACTARGDSPSVNLSMRVWEELPEDLRRANRAQATDIGVKLHAVDCDLVPESPQAPDFAFTDGEIELLAQMEHDRWVGERQSQGYVYGPTREGRHHPDLMDWKSLSGRAKEKDRDAVRQLPAILERAGFQIIRLPPR